MKQDLEPLFKCPQHVVEHPSKQKYAAACRQDKREDLAAPPFAVRCVSTDKQTGLIFGRRENERLPLERAPSVL
jgi:hypothetical protein